MRAAVLYADVVMDIDRFKDFHCELPEEFGSPQRRFLATEWLASRRGPLQRTTYSGTRRRQGRRSREPGPTTGSIRLQPRKAARRQKQCSLKLNSLVAFCQAFHLYRGSYISAISSFDRTQRWWWCAPVVCADRFDRSIRWLWQRLCLLGKWVRRASSRFQSNNYIFKYLLIIYILTFLLKQKLDVSRQSVENSISLTLSMNVHPCSPLIWQRRTSGTFKYVCNSRLNENVISLLGLKTPMWKCSSFSRNINR